jgi:hypothetical protein
MGNGTQAAENHGWIISPLRKIEIMTRRIAKLKVTTTRLQTIELRAFRLLLRCPRCAREVEMLTSQQASGVLEIDRQSFARLIAEGQIHIVRTVSGGIRVCKNSLFLM